VDISLVPYNRVTKYDSRLFRYTMGEVLPPDRLFFCGRDLAVLNATKTVAFGGTVSPVEEAFELAGYLSALAVTCHRKRDVVVISGGAIGIDLAAHLGAIGKSGKTVAVVAGAPANGLNSLVDKHSLVTKMIIECGGGIISERNGDYHSSVALSQRDRIITALSDIFVAVECKANSGTVDTAKRAKIQGKSVIAIDWNNIKEKRHSPQSKGCDQLIREGIARPVPSCEVQDIFDAVFKRQFLALIG
jgi:DNA processing protein